MKIANYLVTLCLATAVFGEAKYLEAAEQNLFVEGNQFVDGAGGVITLRGWNISAKIPPYQTLVSPSSFAQLESWGTNVIRLSYIWEAMEGERGVYSEAYLLEMDRIVSLAAERDINVVIDIHQDAFSRYTLDGCGEGFPEWAVSGNKATPDNGPTCVNWGTRMFNDFSDNGPMQAEWQAFYNNNNGVRDSYLDMIVMLAERYKGNPAVVGIDLMNEPFGEVSQIYGLYVQAAEKIHAVNPQWIIFASPHGMTSGSVMAASFGDMPSIPNLAFSPHYYDPVIMQFHRYQAAGRYLGEDESAGSVGTVSGWFFDDVRTALRQLSAMVDGGAIDVRTPEQAVADLKDIANSWNVPLFIGEFGVHATAIDVATFMDRFYAAMNQYDASGAQWNYAPQWTEENKDGWNYEDLSVVDDQGNARRGYRPQPYVVRLAGDSAEISTLFPQANAAYEKGITLTYKHEPSKGSTKIFIPQLTSDNYLDQFYVSLSAGTYTVDESKKQVVVSSAVAGPITVEVKYFNETLLQGCRIFFKHDGFSCSDGVSINFYSPGYGEDRDIVRYADYPQNQAYDFGEWPLGSEIFIATSRNWSSNYDTKSFQVTPQLCGKVVEIAGNAHCFNASWDLVLP